jgi:hypothetical protein
LNGIPLLTNLSVTSSGGITNSVSVANNTITLVLANTNAASSGGSTNNIVTTTAVAIITNAAVFTSNATNVVPPAGGFSISTDVANTNQITFINADLTNANVTYTWSSFTNAYTNFLSPLTVCKATNSAGSFSGWWMAFSNSFYAGSTSRLDKIANTNAAVYMAPQIVGQWRDGTNFTGGGGTNGTGNAAFGQYIYTNSPNLNFYGGQDGTNKNLAISVNTNGNSTFYGTPTFNKTIISPCISFNLGNEPTVYGDGSSIYVRGGPLTLMGGTGSSGLIANSAYLGFYFMPQKIGILDSGNMQINSTNVLFSGAVVVTNGIASYVSNTLPLTSISFPASTVNWTNTFGKNINVFINNAGVTGTLSINGTQIASTLLVTGDTMIPLQPGEYFSETYSGGTPTAVWKPF